MSRGSREQRTRQQHDRRERRLAEGVPRRVVWGHDKQPSGTGWDSYNARHTGPYSTKSPDYAPEHQEKDMEPTSKQMTLGELSQGVRDGTYSREHLVEAVRDLEVIHDGALVAEPEIDEPEPDYELEMGA